MMYFPLKGFIFCAFPDEGTHFHLIVITVLRIRGNFLPY